MFGIKAKITKFTDDSQPGWVQCEFTDAFEKLHIFNEKVPIVTTEYFDENSIYPQDGIIGCEIIERKNVDNREIIKISTELPWGIESKSDETIFEILPNQLIEFEHNSTLVKDLFIPLQNNMSPNENFLKNLYDAFNRRDIESVLSTMAEDVKWANGWEGGFVYGRDNVREYWRRQFEVITPQLEILEIEIDGNQSITKLHQIAKDMGGNIVDDKIVKHIFTFEKGLIKTFELANETEAHA